MAFAEDWAVFFQTDDFAVPATWNGTTAVAGIFDRAYAPLMDSEGTTPVFTCAESSVPGIKHGDTLLLGSATFKVRGVEPDGTGVMMLRLEEQ